MSTLGQLVWFSVHKTSSPVRLELARAKELFAELSLDPAYLPRAILPVHAFQAASAAVVVTYTDDVTGEQVSLKAKEVSRSSEQHVRHVIRYATNKKTRLTSAGMLIELKFNHARRTVKGRQPVGHGITDRIVKVLVEATSSTETPRKFGISDQDRLMAETWLQMFYENYNELQTHLSADAIRTVVRDLLLSCDAILANPRGGLYFVRAEYAVTTAYLQQFVSSISPECRLHAVTLDDSEENLSMVRDVWLEATREAIARMEAEIAALQQRAAARNGKLTLKPYVSLKEEWDAQKEKATRYADFTGYPSGKLRELTKPCSERIEGLQKLTR